jgi:small subunit ribosomal protein S1
MSSKPSERDDPLRREIDQALDGVNLQDIGDPDAVAARQKSGQKPGPNRGPDPRLKRGTIVGVSGDDVFVEIGPRMQGVVSLREFDEKPAIGAAFDFTLHGREDDLWKLSRRAAQELSAADDIEVGSLVKARVTGQNTGGLELKIGSLAAFLPASMVALRHEDNLAGYLGQTLVCQVLEVDHAKRRVLVSRRAVLEKEREVELKDSLGRLASGQTVKGKVVRIEPFGAFVDIGGGLEGMVHVSQLSRRRVENPNDVVHVGLEVDAKILEIKEGGKRISLSMKELEPDPWSDVTSRFASDMVVTGRVTRLTDFGAFVEVAPGLEGLVHVSQLGKDRVRRASDVVKAGQEISVRILAVEPGRQRMSLSRLDSRGAVLGSDEAVDSSVIDEAMQKNVAKPIGTNLGALFKRALEKPEQR